MNKYLSVNKCLINTIKPNMQGIVYVIINYNRKEIILSKGILYNANYKTPKNIKNYSFKDINMFANDYANYIIAQTPITEKNVLKINTENINKIINSREWREKTLFLYNSEMKIIDETLLKRYDLIEYLTFKSISYDIHWRERSNKKVYLRDKIFRK